MANIVAYPDISLEKFTGLDPSEDVADFLSLIERKIEFSLGIRPGQGDAQNAYDARRKALFGSVLRGPAAQWFDSLPAAEPWDDVRTGFLNRFTDEKDKYRKRIEVENIRRQPDELIKIYVHRLTKAVEKGWPDPFTDAQWQTKCMEFFVRGLTPPALKQKAHQYLIETPNATCEQLRNQVSTKDLSFAVSSDFTGTASSSIDNKMEIDGIKDQLQELASLMKNNRISAAYNPNEPRNKQNHTRFCKFCRKSGHTIAYCYANRDFKKQNRQQPQEISSEITIKAIEDVVQEKIVMIEIRTATDRTLDHVTVTTTKITADNTLLILDLRTITSEIAHKALRIEIDAIIADPTIVDPRTIGTIPGNDNMIETIPEQGIVSQAVQDRIIEEVTVLIRILEITVETVTQTEFNSEKIKLMDSLWTINKMKLI